MSKHLEQYTFPFKNHKDTITISVDSRDENGRATEVGITEFYDKGPYTEATISKKFYGYTSGGKYHSEYAGTIADSTLRMIVNKYGMKKLARRDKDLVYAYVWLKKHVALGLSEEQTNREFSEMDNEKIKLVADLLRYNHYPQMVRDDWYCPRNIVRWFFRDIKNAIIRPFRRRKNVA